MPAAFFSSLTGFRLNLLRGCKYRRQTPCSGRNSARVCAIRHRSLSLGCLDSGRAPGQGWMPGTRFTLPDVKHGVLADTAGMARLFRMVGHGFTMDLIMTPRVTDAEDALRHEVVPRVVDADELEQTAREMAETIAIRPTAVARADS